MRNFGQRRCRYCGTFGGDYGRHTGSCLSKEELKALIDYIGENGRQWRSKLQAEWMSGSVVLRELRNKVGLSGLHWIMK